MKAAVPPAPAPAPVPVSTPTPTPADARAVPQPPKTPTPVQKPPAEPEQAPQKLRQHQPADPLPSQSAAAVKQERIPGDRKTGGNVFIIAGIAVFGLVILGLLISILVNKNKTSPAAVYSEPTPAVSSIDTTPAGQPVKLTAKQQAFIEDVLSQLIEQIPIQSAEINADPLFQAAVKEVQINEAVYLQGMLQITLQFPDPMKLESLDTETYAPRSGEQAYIKKAYAGLISSVGSITQMVGYELDIPFNENANGGITYDKSMPFLFFPLDSYSDAFIPYMEEFMKGRGFYTAASEILLPDFQHWESHEGTEKDAEYLTAYFTSLADALSEKGIDVSYEATVDKSKIQKALETRFYNTWLFEKSAFKTDAYGQVLCLEFPNNFNYFSTAADKIIAQYGAGGITAPSTLSDAEGLFTAETRKHANMMLAESPQSRKSLMLYGEYHYDWQTLGEKGIGACPLL